jgi:hypothetical protein
VPSAQHSNMDTIVVLELNQAADQIAPVAVGMGAK